MQNGLPTEPEIASESAYVLYDSRTGQIAHGHTIKNYKGARKITRKEEEQTVFAAAEQFGHKMAGLKLLSVPLKDFDFSVPVRVDLKTVKLIRLEVIGPPRKSGPGKSTKRKPKAKTKR